mgnify:CR=1 FL=1
MTNEQKREMLALAAKAAETPVSMVSGVLCVFDEECYAKPWNPLDDDGDCARLEARLKIFLLWGDNDVEAFVYSFDSGYGRASYADHGNDHQAAHHLAVVKMAAAIGKAMS